MSLSEKHVELSEKWHKDVQETRDWCKETQAKLENMEKSGDASNYDELSERKKELQVRQSGSALFTCNQGEIIARQLIVDGFSRWKFRM